LNKHNTIFITRNRPVTIRTNITQRTGKARFFLIPLIVNGK
jgi:hypothetical protein